MAKKIEEIVAYVKNHRCFTHPIFNHWVQVRPGPESVGALFHQIQCFCASTRPGWNFAEALKDHGMDHQGDLVQAIVDSEEDHGPELATMAGHILNRTAKSPVCADLYDQKSVEAKLRQFSDKLLGSLPGYDKKTGLTVQARKAINVFERRKLTDRDSTIRNLGTALALEMISNQQLIPGEKNALVDSGIYNTTLEEPEMHYLLEHWGEIGAEQQHEKNAIEAVAAVLNDKTEALIFAGIDDFLDSLVNLWDVLDSALLGSGSREASVTAA